MAVDLDIDLAAHLVGVGGEPPLCRKLNRDDGRPAYVLNVWAMG